jgi:hypothetical protein
MALLSESVRSSFELNDVRALILCSLLPGLVASLAVLSTRKKKSSLFRGEETLRNRVPPCLTIVPPNASNKLLVGM